MSAARELVRRRQAVATDEPYVALSEKLRQLFRHRSRGTKAIHVLPLVIEVEPLDRALTIVKEAVLDAAAGRPS